MKKYNMVKNSFLFLGLLLISQACQVESENKTRVDSLPYYEDATFTPKWITDEIPENAHKIRPFSLINQEGKTITEKSFENKIYIADFFFATCPGICPRMTKNMHKVQEAFMDVDDLLIISHSVTPNIDTVELLAEYGVKNNINPKKWFLVTGEKKEIYDLGRHYYFVEEDLGVNKTDEDFLHTENFVLIDKNRHIRGIYNGLNNASIDQLIADVEGLLKEK